MSLLPERTVDLAELELLGRGHGTIVASDSTWSTFWVDGEAQGELYQSFQFDFPAFADTWNMLYITTEATAYGDKAYSFIDLKVPFVMFYEP